MVWLSTSKGAMESKTKAAEVPQSPPEAEGFLAAYTDTLCPAGRGTWGVQPFLPGLLNEGMPSPGQTPDCSLQIQSLDFLWTATVQCFRSLDHLHSDEAAIFLSTTASQEL